MKHTPLLGTRTHQFSAMELGDEVEHLIISKSASGESFHEWATADVISVEGGRAVLEVRHA